MEGAEPRYIFGIDYVKIIPDDGSGPLFTKDECGVDVIDPVTAAKDEIIGMFNSWFAADKPEETRELAVKLANKTALRRNPEVRKALAVYVEHETNFKLRQSIQNILNSDDKIYGAQLRKLITEQEPPQGTDGRRLDPRSQRRLCRGHLALSGLRLRRNDQDPRERQQGMHLLPRRTRAGPDALSRAARRRGLYPSR